MPQITCIQSCQSWELLVTTRTTTLCTHCLYCYPLLPSIHLIIHLLWTKSKIQRYLKQRLVLYSLFAQFLVVCVPSSCVGCYCVLPINNNTNNNLKVHCKKLIQANGGNQTVVGEQGKLSRQKEMVGFSCNCERNWLPFAALHLHTHRWEWEHKFGFQAKIS